jgi:hypothetical protein
MDEQLQICEEFRGGPMSSLLTLLWHQSFRIQPGNIIYARAFANESDPSGRAVSGLNCLSPLEHWDPWFESHLRHGCQYAFVLCLCCSVCALRRADPPSKESYRLCKKVKKLKSGQGPTKGCRTIDRFADEIFLFPRCFITATGPTYTSLLSVCHTPSSMRRSGTIAPIAVLTIRQRGAWPIGKVWTFRQ